MDGLLDIHQHVVYGVDDGPDTIHEAIEMLEVARESGVTHIVGTSHAIPSMQRFPVERYYRHLQGLNALSRERGLGITVYDGCEVFYSDIALRQLMEGKLPTLARSRFVLMEFDPTSRFEAIEEAVRKTSNIGLIPVLAHCERYDALVKHAVHTVRLRNELRMRIQLNASCITKKCPRSVRKFRNLLLDEGAVDYIASDAHNRTSRPPNLREAYECLAEKYGYQRAIRWMRGNQNEIFCLKNQ